MKLSSISSVDRESLRMNLQILLVLLCCASQSFALSESSCETNFMKVCDNKLKINRVKMPLPDENTPEIMSNRLPNSSVPLKYDIFIKTDIDKESYNFSGRVKIHVKIIETTKQITLHYYDAPIDKIDLTQVDKTLIAANLDFKYDKTFSFLIISIPRIVFANREMILDISYRGELRGRYRDKLGFYCDSYITNNEKVWFATTKFNPSEARHAFPCYDEPEFRAAIGVEIQHNKNYNAISNMPIINREEVAGTDYVTSKFQYTPPMSTYLLSFAISDFTFISNNDTKVEQRIYAKPQSIDRGKGALSFVGPNLKKFEEHFGVDFPLPKIDYTATTHQWTLENFELSHAFENNIQAIAHEIGQQYFSNIVTPKWWSHDWMNGALTKLYEYYIPSLLYPTGTYMERFSKTFVRQVVKNDEIGFYRPLNLYDESPGYFHDNSHKGAVVLRMFQEALPVDMFTKGLKNYLRAMIGSTATPEDLHRELQNAYDDEFPGNDFNIGEAMKTWEDQTKFPSMFVEKSEQKFILTQKRFDYSESKIDEIYTIPISYASKSDANFENTTAKFWMKTKTAEIESSDEKDWIFLDPKSSKFFTTRYGDNALNAFAEQLMANHEVFPKAQKKLMLTFFNQLLESNENAVYALKSLSYLKDDKEFTLWEYSHDIINFFREHLFGTPVYPQFQKFLQSLAKPHLDRLGFEPIQGESKADEDTRDWVVSYSCSTNQVDCLNYQLKEVVNSLESGKKNIELCHGLKLANATVHAEVMKNFVPTIMQKDMKFVQLSSCSLDREILQNKLELILNNSTNLGDSLNIFRLMTIMKQSPLGMELALNFIIENLDKLVKIVPGRFYAYLTQDEIYGRIHTKENFDKMQTIIKLMTALNEISDDRLDSFNKNLEESMEWTEKNSKPIEDWLNESQQN